MSRVVTQCHWLGCSVVAGGVYPVRWPNVTSAIVRVPSARWRDREVSIRIRKYTYTDCQGKLLPCGKPGDPEAHVLVRRLFRLFAGAFGVALQACVVQVPPPPGGGGPRRRADRLASSVGGRFHARTLSWGAALIRGPVCRAARGRLPRTRSGNLPQGGVIALEVCLS